VQAVMQAQGRSVTRQALLALIGKPDNLTNRRNLDAVISRIRAKVRTSTHTDLPLRASYASGYAFVPGRTSDAEPATANPG
jgi:DNA-binding response OmpR family regulator